MAATRVCVVALALLLARATAQTPAPTTQAPWTPTRPWTTTRTPWTPTKPGTYAPGTYAPGTYAPGTSSGVVELWRYWLQTTANASAHDGLLLLPNLEENYYLGGFSNELQAFRSSPGQNYPITAWELHSFGQVKLSSSCYAFQALPQTLFVVVNNQQPPNVSAVASNSGAVLWTSVAAFRSVYGANLTSSVDGTMVYMMTLSPQGQPQLTAFASSNGATLFNLNEVGASYASAMCGERADIPCLAWFDRSGVLRFVDGRTGASLGAATVPFPPSWNSAFTSLPGGLLLLSTEGGLAAVETVKFSVAWQVASTGATPIPYQVQTFDNETATVVVVITQGGVAGLSASTGEALWNVTAEAVCPYAPPGVELTVGSALGSFPSGISDGSLFSSVFNCSTPDGGLLIAGAMSAADGNLFWWEAIDQLSFKFPFLRLGEESFVLLNGGHAAFYGVNASVVQKIGSYPPASLPYQIVDAWTTNGMAYFQLGSQGYSYNQFAAVMASF